MLINSSHNQNKKAHRNGITKTRTQRYTSMNGESSTNWDLMASC
jgi:hypothetical protein